MPSTNRVQGDTPQINKLPNGPGISWGDFVVPGIGSPGLGSDVLFVPSTAAAGTPSVRVNLNALPSDGDEITICDPFGVLAAGTTLIIDGNGNFIANGAAAAQTTTLNTAGACLRLMFSTAVQSGGAKNSGTWLAVND